MNRTCTAVLSTALIAALGGTAACSSSGGTPAASSPPASSSTPSTAPTTVVSTSTTTVAANSSAVPAPGSAARSGSGTSACAESQLRANATLNNIAGLNRHVVKLTFTNTSSSSCTLTGYPGAAIEDSSNKQVQQAKRVIGGPVGGTIERSAGTLTLRPGATAYAWLEGVSTREQGAAQAGCDAAKYPRILVTPPNTDTPVPFTIGWPQCYSFDIHPVRED